MPKLRARDAVALGRALKQTLERPRFRSSKRDRFLLCKCTSQDDSKVVEGRRRPGARERSLSQVAHDAFVEGEPAPVQVELDQCRQNRRT